VSTALATLEALVDASGVAAAVEAAMPTGGRPRQLPVRALLVGALLAVSDGRPAHLTRLHQALVALPEADQARLGVLAPTRRGPHRLTYRQVERTFNTMVATMGPTPVPSFAGIDAHERPAHLEASRAGVDAAGREARLLAFCDRLVEASVPEEHKAGSSSFAVDWTDHASWARPAGPGAMAVDPDASWGHRNTNTPGTKDGLFFGYYAQAVTAVADDGGPAVPELVRRVALDAPSVDPPTVMAATLVRMHDDGVAVGDVVADSGYAHRVPERWATPLRRIGARLVQDLHPHDRGPRGTHEGAVLANGNLWCPATPLALLGLGPLPRGATAEQAAAHDRSVDELAHYKLGRLTADDADGYHRVACPAAAGKLRCPLKEPSMALGFEHPEVLRPPAEPPRCCAQATVTVPPSVNAKTRQKHDYPSPAHRRSYARRTGAERSFATMKDPSATDTRRGWCRMLGRTKNLVVLAFAAVARNLRALASFRRREDDDARRASAGLAPRTRARRRAEPAAPG
jgi:hypothetical protein